MLLRINTWNHCWMRAQSQQSLQEPSQWSATDQGTLSHCPRGSRYLLNLPFWALLRSAESSSPELSESCKDSLLETLPVSLQSRPSARGHLMPPLQPFKCLSFMESHSLNHCLSIYTPASKNPERQSRHRAEQHRSAWASAEACEQGHHPPQDPPSTMLLVVCVPASPSERGWASGRRVSQPVGAGTDPGRQEAEDLPHSGPSFPPSQQTCPSWTSPSSSQPLPLFLLHQRPRGSASDQEWPAAKAAGMWGTLSAPKCWKSPCGLKEALREGPVGLCVHQGRAPNRTRDMVTPPRPSPHEDLCSELQPQGPLGSHLTEPHLPLLPPGCPLCPQQEKPVEVTQVSGTKPRRGTRELPGQATNKLCAPPPECLWSLSCCRGGREADLHQAPPRATSTAPPLLYHCGWRLGEQLQLTGESLAGSSGFLTTGVFRARGEGTSRGLLELGWGDGNGGCTGGLGRDAGLTRVLAGFRGASGGWSSREVLASSPAAGAAGFGVLLMTGAFLGWLAGLGAWREGGLLGAFLITAGKGGDRGRWGLRAGSWKRLREWEYQSQHETPKKSPCHPRASPQRKVWWSLPRAVSSGQPGSEWVWFSAG